MFKSKILSHFPMTETNDLPELTIKYTMEFCKQFCENIYLCDENCEVIVPRNITPEILNGLELEGTLIELTNTLYIPSHDVFIKLQGDYVANNLQKGTYLPAGNVHKLIWEYTRKSI